MESKMRFLSAAKPILEEGFYSAAAKQTLSGSASETFNAENVSFYVGFPHFSLPEDDIYSFYPGRNAVGIFANTLPHIVFSRSTLPFERSVGEGSWLALVVVSKDESDGFSEITIKDLLTTRPGNVFFPLGEGDVVLIEEKPEDLCTVVDLTIDVFDSVMPLCSETRFLAHVKRVQDEAMLKKPDEVLAYDGDFSVIVANRFVPSGTEKTESTVHLVSLEGYAPYLVKNRPAFPTDIEYIRLVSLYHWDISSYEDTSPGFAKIFKALNTSSLAVDNGVLARGHVPMTHKTRSGETTVSLYHGPLLPYDIKNDGDKRHNNESFTADGQIVYDPSTGIFDMTYAAAWQLGRLLAISDKAAAINIFHWRRGMRTEKAIATTRAIFSEKARELNTTDFLEFFAKTICPALAADELIAPSARKNEKEGGE